MISKSAVNMHPTNFILGTSSKNWIGFLAMGIIFIILGIVGVGMAATITLVSVLFFGWLLSIGGVLLFIQAFTLQGNKSKTFQAIMALLYIITGGFVITYPIAGAGALTALIAINFIVLGVGRCFMALMFKGSSTWVWLLLSGIIPIFFGIYIFVNWTQNAILIIGLLISIELIVAGWSY